MKKVVAELHSIDLSAEVDAEGAPGDSHADIELWLVGDDRETLDEISICVELTADEYRQLREWIRRMGPTP